MESMEQRFTIENSEINNEIYNELGDRWYDASDDPVALLRSENQARMEWIHSRILPSLGSASEVSVLDLGCGAGFFTNPTAKKGFQVSGVDISESSLEVARNKDETKSVSYTTGDITSLQFEAETFDVVCCLDVLEHVENPEKVVAEASRVLKKNGQFFFYTFNRNLLSRLIIIKAVEWFIKNTPKNLHLYEMFITPEELDEMLVRNHLVSSEWTGLRPRINRALLKTGLTGKVSPGFSFTLTRSLKLGYLGRAQKIK